MLVMACLSLFAFQLHAESIRTQTGYYYPLGTDNIQVSSCGRWLTKPEGQDDGGCYPYENVYHIGVDLVAENVGENVRAISDGKVLDHSPNDWGDGNIALLVEHESAEHGSFTAIYGHVQRSGAKAIGSAVRAGETIGKIGYWSNGVHLHFGIVHPDLTYPIGGFGRAYWSQWGKLNSSGYYDNGLIDPIDFMVHSGPDNYMSRFPYVIPNPITTESAWFYDLCYIANTPDARCSSQSIQFYFECVGENWPGCAVDPSVWSAVGETGKTSANTYGVGGDGYIPPENPQPNDPVNLTQDTDILGADGNELYAGRDVFLDGMKAKIRVAVKAKGGDAGNWKTKGSSRIIHIKYLVSTNDGPWNV
ncbi:MAG: M23 family metallopeptidase, partial [Candidatus Moranbacteria bacterium]|nr:M23 family metallopeptidase [Candidatus Moranbacteria bacterium]